MILLSLFFNTIQADLLFSNQYNSTLGIQSILNFCENLQTTNKLSVTMTSQGKEIPLLAVCAQSQDIETFKNLLNQDNFEQSNCLIDYNAYSFQTQTQQISITRQKVSTQVSLAHNIYPIENNQCFVMIYSRENASYVVTIESVQENSCARKCKNQGMCVNGYCQCPLGCFGSDCGIMASKIDNQTYFQGLQVFYLDLITLQSSNFNEKLNSQLNLTILCYYQSPHLHLPTSINNTLFIDQSQIQECKIYTQALHQSTKLQYFPQFVFITSTESIVQVVISSDQSEIGIPLIAALTSFLGLILLLSFIVYCCRKKNEKEQQKIKLQIENLMPAFQFISVTDRLPNSREEQQCSICLDKFQLNSIVRMTYCEHVFHAKCLQSWIKKNKNCPLCRALLDTETIQAKVKIESKTNIQPSHNILQQLSVFQKNEGSLTSIDGSLTHSPIVQLKPQKPSRFRLS